MLLVAAEAIRVEKLQAKAMKKTEKNVKNEKDSKEIKIGKKDIKLEINDDATISDNVRKDEQKSILNDKNKLADDGTHDSTTLHSITNNFNIISGKNHRNSSISVGEDSPEELSNDLLLSAVSSHSSACPENMFPSSSSSSASSIIDTKNVPEKRSSRIRVPKKNQLEEYSSISHTTEMTDSVEEEENVIEISEKTEECSELIKKEKGKNGEGEAEEMDVDDDDDENILLTVPIPEELTPNPNPISYLPCVVYSLSAEEAYFSCCLDQVCAYVHEGKNPIIACILILIFILIFIFNFYFIFIFILY